MPPPQHFSPADAWGRRGENKVGRAGSNGLKWIMPANRAVNNVTKCSALLSGKVGVY